ncbi:MAG: indolepyruvate decarboxylase [Granulosicoccus sp.]
MLNLVQNNEISEGTKMSGEYTAADYLKERLEQMGVQQMFGVAGNFTAPFLDTILQDSNSPLKIVGCPNELCAGYAADGYARVTDFGVIFTTYSVGAFNALNAIAGAYTEQIPVLLVNGAPTNKEDARQKYANVLSTHSTGNVLADLEVFRPVTVSAERITNATSAPAQIDTVLTAMVTHKRPGYLEVTEDVWRASCAKPLGKIESGRNAIVTVSQTSEAVAATVKLLNARPNIALWAGTEVRRQGLEQAFLSLLETINAQVADDAEPVSFITAPLSKSVIDESHPRFGGCLTLTETEVKKFTGNEGCLLGIGSWTIAKNTAGQDIRGAGTVIASHDYVQVGVDFFLSVNLSAYISQLEVAIVKEKLGLTGLTLPPKPKLPLGGTNGMTYDIFFAELQKQITADDVLVVDAGFPLSGAQHLVVGGAGGFYSQGAWLAIGWSVGAAVGIRSALPDKRVFNIVGDGAFQETCQALSNNVQLGHNTVTFVIANGLYGVEQALVNPNPFRDPAVLYTDELLNAPYQYNILPKWDLKAMAQAFGLQGRVVEDGQKLVAVFEEIRTSAGQNFLIQISVPELDVPGNLVPFLPYVVGEDELENSAWPPANKF